MEDKEGVLGLGDGCDGDEFDVCLAILPLSEDLREHAFEVVLLAYFFHFFEVLDVVLDLLDIGLFFLPQHVGLCRLPSHHYRNQQHLLADKHELQLSRSPVGDCSHPGKLQFVELETELFVDELISAFVDGVSVDVVFGEGDFAWGRLSFGHNIDEDGFARDDVVVVDGDIVLALDVQFDEVPEDLVEALAPRHQDIVALATFDGVLGDDGDGSLEAVNFSLAKNFFLVLGNLGLVVLLVVDLAHADLIAALVVDQDEPLFALATDVPENVVFTTQNVDVTLSFIEVVKISAL